MCHIWLAVASLDSATYDVFFKFLNFLCCSRSFLDHLFLTINFPELQVWLFMCSSMPREFKMRDRVSGKSQNSDHSKSFLCFTVFCLRSPRSSKLR